MSRFQVVYMKGKLTQIFEIFHMIVDNLGYQISLFR